MGTTDGVIKFVDQALIFEAKSDFKIAVRELCTGKKDLDFGFGNRMEFGRSAEFNSKSVEIIKEND